MQATQKGHQLRWWQGDIEGADTKPACRTPSPLDNKSLLEKVSRKHISGSTQVVRALKQTQEEWVMVFNEPSLVGVWGRNSSVE